MPKAMSYTRGSIIFFEGDKDDRIFILQSGAVVLKSSDLLTGAQIMDQIHVGEFFGVKSALSQMPRMETASVAADCQVVTLTVPEFEKIFSGNQNVTLKMLRVFSKTLRDLHAKTEVILHNVNVDVKPDEAMLAVAKSFYENEEYHSCCSSLNHLLLHFPDTGLKSQVEDLLKDSESKEGIQAREGGDKVLQTGGQVSNSAILKQFSLPMFDRFTSSYKNGDVIVCEHEPGENFYFIKSGEVQVVKCIRGAKKNLDILYKGEFFGEMAILDNSPRGASCVARGDTECLVFNKENFKTIVTGNPLVVMQLLKIFCKRIYDQHRRIKNLTITEISARIADVFLMYDEMQPANAKEENSNKRKFNASVADIASWAALSVDVVRDELNKYVDRGKIEIFDGYMNISNIMDIKRTVDSYYSAHQ